jgi:DNA-binding SARP family transcriptional activator
VHRDAVVTTDRLVAELWPTAAPPTAAKIVRNLVSELRKLVGGSNGVVLETEAGGYRLRLPGEQIDAVRFQRLVEQGIRLREHGEVTDAARILREALALWRGEPFADVADEQFAASEAARLEELRLVCLEERIDADLALGRDAELVPELETLIRREPLRERLRAQLMLALHRSGRQADALAAYQDARRTLVAELGLEPRRELQELERAILDQDPSLDAPERRAAQSRRRGYSVVALGIAALLLVAAAAAVVASRDHEALALTGLAPNTVGAIDPETGRSVAQVPLGAAANRLASSDEVLWVLSTT